MLFYKVGPSPSAWWGMLKRSEDSGISWSPATRLPDGQVGPIKNKPWLLADGRLLCGSSTEDQGSRVHMEWTADLGKTWQRTQPLNDGKTMHAIQPTILQHGANRLQILCRGRGTGRIVQAWSDDAGRTWSEMTVAELPNPNSGIDGVTLRDGRHLLVYNHTPRGRSPLNVAISEDGRNWQAAMVLEEAPGEFSYPAVIQTKDGLVHIAYTWKRQRIKHVVLDPRQFSPREIRNGVGLSSRSSRGGADVRGARPRSRLGLSLGQQLTQVEMEFAQLPAVIAGTDRDDAFAGCGPHRVLHCLADGRRIDSIDHNS